MSHESSGASKVSNMFNKYDEEWKRFKMDLYSWITGAEATGSFAMHDRVPNFVLPNISLVSSKKPGKIFGLPLGHDDAQSLIEMSRQTPFDKDTDAVIVEKFTQPWQIKSEAVRFNNMRWTSCVDSVAKIALAKLGVGERISRQIDVEFDKMLIYEEGATFKSHRDTKNSSRNFATLMICLPSAHTGGDVCVKYGSSSMRIPSSNSSDVTFMAWYNDVEHEIEPVTSGYRWVLVYNLVQNPNKLMLSAELLDGHVTYLKTLLKELATRWSYQPPLLYPLTHKYLKYDLKMEMLQEQDLQYVSYILQGCAEQAGLTVLLANLELVKSDQPDGDGNLNGEEKLTLAHVVDLDGFSWSDQRNLEIAASSIIGKNLFKKRKPDTQPKRHAVKNAGAEIDQLFYGSAVLIIPDDHVWETLLGTHYSDAAVEELMSSFREIADRGTSKLSSKRFLRTMCEGMMGRISEEIDRMSDPIRDALNQKENERSVHDVRVNNLDHQLGSVAVSAIFLHDMALFRETVSKMESSFNEKTYYELGRLIDIEKLEEVDKMVLTRAFEHSGQLHTTLNNLWNFRQGSKYNKKGASCYQVDNMMITHVEKMRKTFPHDAEILVKIKLDNFYGPSPFLPELDLYISDFIERFANDPHFAIPCLIELLYQARSSSKDLAKLPYFKPLIKKLLKSTVSAFDLQIFSSYHRVSGAVGLDRERPFVALYNCVQTGEPELLIPLLEQIRIQATATTGSWYDLKMVTHLLHALPGEGQGSISVLGMFSDCVVALLTAYATKNVGYKPELPKDWSRPDEVADCTRFGGGCQCCLMMNDFLNDPKRESCFLLDSRDKRHVRQQYRKLDVSTIPSGQVMATKTLSGWKEQHENWLTRCERIRDEFKALPMHRLKDCIGPCMYEGVMNLEAFEFERPYTAGPMPGSWPLNSRGLRKD